MIFLLILYIVNAVVFVAWTPHRGQSFGPREVNDRTGFMWIEVGREIRGKGFVIRRYSYWFWSRLQFVFHQCLAENLAQMFDGIFRRQYADAVAKAQEGLVKFVV